MNVTERIEPSELFRILNDSGLWDSVEEIQEAVESREGFTVIEREGGHIDRAIGDYYIDDRDIMAGEVPANWAVYIDSEALGRDIRLSDYNGRAVDLIDDPTGLYGRDWNFYVIRD